MPGFLADALTRPNNRWLVQILKSARSWSLPPLTLITGEETSWTDERNRLLAVALTILESESCDSCGTPAWIGQSTSRDIVFDVDSSTCFGCAELEKASDDESRSQRKRARGEVRFVTARNAWPDQSLPSRHELYRAEDEKNKNEE